MAVQYLTNRNPDGTCLGYASTDPIAFYGATPAARTAFTATAVATTAPISTTSGVYGFSTAVQAAGIISLVNEIRAALVTLGLKA